jgi:hypothetical protein
MMGKVGWRLELIALIQHEQLLGQKGQYYAMWRQQIGERGKPSAI